VEVAGGQAGAQLAQSVVGEAFLAGDEQPSDAIQGSALAAAVAQRVLLHPPADLVDDLVAESQHVEGIHHDLRGVEPPDQRVVVAAIRVGGHALDTADSQPASPPGSQPVTALPARPSTTSSSRPRCRSLSPVTKRYADEVRRG
jgi:hypothetical protein